MGRIRCGNIYSKILHAKDKEVSQTLMENKKLKIERIVSSGQITEKGKWLKETLDEWVIVLQGSGRLRFRKGNRLINLMIGDYVFIPANTFHRVEWTDPKQKTVWLAVYSR
jgi:cupin 2 domain-containing protein